eukprot:gene38938-52581_t
MTNTEFKILLKAIYRKDWQTAFAEEMEVNRSTVMRWEKGLYVIPFTAVKAIKQLLKKRMTELKMLNERVMCLVAVEQFTAIGDSKMTKDFKVKRLHQGQKRAYGDSFYEYEVISDFPVEDVEKYCTTELRKAIPKNQYLTDLRDLQALKDAINRESKSYDILREEAADAHHALIYDSAVDYFVHQSLVKGKERDEYVRDPREWWDGQDGEFNVECDNCEKEFVVRSNWSPEFESLTVEDAEYL